MILPTCSPAEFKVLAFVCRKTFGWQKTHDRISLTQFQRGTGLSRQCVVTSLARMTESQLLNKRSTPQGDAYELNLSYDGTGQLSGLVNSVDQSSQLTGTGQLSGPTLVNSVDTQKQTKETKKQTIRRKNLGLRFQLISLPTRTTNS